MQPVDHEQGPRPGLHVMVVAEHAERLDEHAAQGRTSIRFVVDGFVPEALVGGCEQGAYAIAQHHPGLTVDQSVELTESGHHALPHRQVALVDERLQQTEEVVRFVHTGKHPCPVVVDDAVTLDRREVALGVCDERVAQSGGVAHAVEPHTLGVAHDPLGRFEEGDVHGAVLEQDLLESDDAVRRAALGEDQRDRPRRGPVVGGGVGPAGVAEAVLCDPQRAAVVDQVDRDGGEAGLEDPRVHDPAHRLARGRLDGVPQVGGLGVVVLVGRQVVPDAGPELLGPEVLLEHADDRGTLLVGEDVEHPLGVGR